MRGSLSDAQTINHQHKEDYSQPKSDVKIDEGCTEESAAFRIGEWSTKSAMESESCDIKKRSFFGQKNTKNMIFGSHILQHCVITTTRSKVYFFAMEHIDTFLPAARLLPTKYLSYVHGFVAQCLTEKTTLGT